MKLLIFTIIASLNLLSGSLPSCSAQVSTQQLIGTKWKIISPVDDDEETTWEFSKSQITEKTTWDNKLYEFKNPYYISNYLPTFYTESLVGKIATGKYLVIQIGKKHKRMDWYTIQSVNWTTGDLYLFRQRVEDEFDNHDTLIHLKLIK
jgi:hypothetical protein